MKPRSIQDMIRAKEQIERGKTAPAAVWEVRPNAKGSLARRAVAPRKFQYDQQAQWAQSIAGTRGKLGLSQAQFAKLLGISLRTLHHWEQGTRTPSGAARVLLRVASRHPEIVLEATA
jgi:DNA-binding transcriptional regulator YiaG